jgi:hypothetical protein
LRGGNKCVPKGVRGDGFGDPGAVSDLADEPARAVPVDPPSVGGQEHRPVGALADGQVDGPGGARRQRDRDDLAALAGDGQRPVPALQAQVLDVGAGRFGDPQAVQGQQGDERVFGRRAEPGGRQHRAELVAVQRDGMRLVVDPRPPDMGGGRVIEEFFFDGVLVEPGDGRQAPGDCRAGSAVGFELPGEAFDVGAAHREQRQGTAATPSGELAQVQGVGLAGQAAVPGQVAGEGESFGVGEGGLDRGERGRWGGSGHRAPPGQAGTREAGPVPAPAVQRKSNVSCLARSRYADNKRAAWRSNPYEEHSIPPIPRAR